MSPKAQIAGRTDKGLVRPGNEDYLHLDEINNVYAVCDGMGGHQAGEVASMTASETIEKAFRHFSEPLLEETAFGFDRALPPSTELLLKSIMLANRTIYGQATDYSNLAGMGTTIVSAALEADIMSVAHVGDSRAYRLEKDCLRPLTRDHSWLVEMQDSQKLTAEEASTLVTKNVITRALGVRDTVEIDCRIIKVKPGDTFILCSDGLCGFADDDEIFAVANRRQDDIERMADDLIQMANDRGGSDNVTVIVLRIMKVQESQLPECDVFTVGPELSEAREAEDIWISRLAETDLTESSKNTAESKKEKGNNFLLFGIFVIFAAVAALILYLSQAN